MKKRILSLVMVISIIFSVLVPIQANAASNADEVIKSRIDELSSKLVGKYFTTDQNCCHNSSCEACKVNNVITQGWFTEEFETISDVNNLARYYYFDNDVDYTIGGPTLGEHSCAGFASFAEWYIFKESNSDRVETELVGVYPVSEVAQHAKLGDMLRIKWKTNSGSWSYHSGIYLGQNSPTSVYILDSNGLYKDENKVTVHDFTCEAVVITRAKNRDSVASNPADDPKPTDNPKPTPKETEEPIENLKYGDYLYYDINSDNTVTITKCDDEAEKIVIPETIDGMKVTVIGESAFADCGNLTSVKIPDSVIAIMNEAFYHCYRLPSITIPDSVTSIGDQAFCMCKLNSIILSNNLTSIGWAAFEGNPFFQDESNWENGVLYMNKYLIHANSTEISSDYTIKDGTRLIGDFAFLGSSLTSVTIPKSVTNIGEFAFEDCSGLTDVYYAGTKAQWDAISIELNNSELIYANIHCSDTEETKEPKKYGDYLYYTINKDNTITITRCDRLAKKSRYLVQ